MKIILLIIFWAVSVTIPVMIITLAALREREPELQKRRKEQL